MNEMAQITIDGDGTFYGDSFDMNGVSTQTNHLSINTKGNEEITLNREAVKTIVQNAPDSWK